MLLVLAEADRKVDHPDTKQRMRDAENRAKLAERELAQDFPVLHALAVVGLWSLLENVVRGLLTLWILHRKDSYSIPAIQKLRIRLGEYAAMSRSEQAEYLVELLEQDIASAFKQGVNRFETMLQPFSLSGALSDENTKLIFELQQVRNLFAHRNGVVDRRFALACPWLKARRGAPLKISAAMFQSYVAATNSYVKELILRVSDIYGLDYRSHVSRKA